jgi:cytidine deaminase
LMAEFGVRRVIVDTPEGLKEHTMAELLPYGFRFE